MRSWVQIPHFISQAFIVQTGLPCVATTHHKSKMSDVTNTSKISPECLEDYFCVLSQNGISKTITVVISIISQLLIPPVLLSIILFEKFGSDKRRPFANKLTSSICWSGMSWGILVHIPWIIRVMVGPFPNVVCLGMMLFRKVITNQVSLVTFF